MGSILAEMHKAKGGGQSYGETEGQASDGCSIKAPNVCLEMLMVCRGSRIWGGMRRTSEMSTRAEHSKLTKETEKESNRDCRGDAGECRHDRGERKVTGTICWGYGNRGQRDRNLLKKSMWLGAVPSSYYYSHSASSN